MKGGRFQIWRIIYFINNDYQKLLSFPPPPPHPICTKAEIPGFSYLVKQSLLILEAEKLVWTGVCVADQVYPVNDWRTRCLSLPVSASLFLLLGVSPGT